MGQGLISPYIMMLHESGRFSRQSKGRVVELGRVGGLHHEYVRMVA